MPTKLTAKQTAILNLLEEFYRLNNYFPSTREIATALGIKSSNTIFSHLKALERKGHLTKNHKGQIISLHNSPSISDLAAPQSIIDNISSSFSLPYFAQTIPAGPQSPAENSSEEKIVLDQYVIRNPRKTFALKVRGDSMELAGIMPGDLLLVEKSSEAKSGQIIVAHLPDGFTVKRYIEKDGQQFLQAESNHNYQIPLQEGTVIWGIVIGTIRKYNY